MAEWLREMSVGQWYQADAEPFEVVGVDVRAEIVLVQYFDGTLGEIDFDAWSDLKARPIPPPEDYSGAMDMGRDDHDGLESDAGVGSNRWDNPLDLLDLRDL
jgi:hypothetical protein